MNSDRDILAIVGRPNVGKSALFNRIVGRRIAIVHEEAGVTRDRVSALATFEGKTFEVVDTGGIAFFDEEKTSDVLAQATKHQAEVAIAMASALILVVDVTAGVTPLDREVARKVRASGKPVFLAVNKVDHEGRQAAVAEFSELGLPALFPIAAIHGRGVAELLAAATADFRAGSGSGPVTATRIAIVGRPNVGKSSIVNAILKDERTIVSEIPGTTRDSVDVPFALGDRSYVLIDTAGLRHRRKIATSVDQFGLMRAERTIRECNVAVLVLDAVAGVTRQDKKIGGLIAEARRACVILVNKWDLAAEMDEKLTKRKAVGGRRKNFREEYVEALRRELFFLDWASVSFVSAKTGKGLADLFTAIGVIERERQKRVPTPELNRELMRALESYPPPMVRGKRFKVYYAFQKPAETPVFVLFCNDAACLTPHYERFLADRIRSRWGFTGCPVVFELRPREAQKFTQKSLQKHALVKK